MARELERSETLAGAHLIWSMWPGYLREDRMSRFREFLDRNEIPISFLHASGHATVEDLQRVAEGAAADQVIPIHTAAPGLYPNFFANVEAHPDGVWWSV
jgi:ribonuclease J